MVKKHFSDRNWIILFILASAGIVTFLALVDIFHPTNIKFLGYTFSFILPPISVMDMLITFIVGFFPSVISRIYANVKTDEVKLNREGVIESFKDSCWGWIIYYSLLVVGFFLYDYVIWGQLPSISIILMRLI